MPLPSALGLNNVGFLGCLQGGDPIAGLLSLRLQTHRGDDVPRDLYKDTACTIPATQHGDVVAAARTPYGEGVVALQTNAMKRPTLDFLGGIPTLLFDGIDDCLEFALSASIPQPNCISICLDQGRGLDNGGLSVDRQLVNPSLGTSFGIYAGTQIASGTQVEGDLRLLTGFFNGANSELWLDGILVTQGDIGTSAFGSDGFLGSDGGPTIACRLVAVGVYSGARNPIIDTYFASLIS